MEVGVKEILPMRIKVQVGLHVDADGIPRIGFHGDSLTMESRGHALICLRPHLYNITSRALMDSHLTISAVALEFPVRWTRELSE
jgi:hypothetical protein